MTEGEKGPFNRDFTKHIWDEIGAVEARILDEKECFFVLDRGIIRTNDDGTNDLKYYPSDDDEYVDYIQLDDIKTTKSTDDNYLKYKLIRFSAYRIILGILGLIFITIIYINIDLISSIFIETTSIIFVEAAILLFMALVFHTLVESIMHTRFNYVMNQIDNNFTRMTNQWATSIAEFLGHDIHGRIFGIRSCMLEFRRFIKWRRFANIYNSMFNWIFFPIAFFVLLIFLTTAVVTLHELGTNLNNILMRDITYIVIITFFFVYPLRKIARIRRILVKIVTERTRFRDPTVQLAVMVSEMHQRFVQRKMA
jgi:hypothetical protein